MSSLDSFVLGGTAGSTDCSDWNAAYVSREQLNSVKCGGYFECEIPSRKLCTRWRSRAAFGRRFLAGPELFRQANSVAINSELLENRSPLLTLFVDDIHAIDAMQKQRHKSIIKECSDCVRPYTCCSVGAAQSTGRDIVFLFAVLVRCCRACIELHKKVPDGGKCLACARPFVLRF